MEGLLQSLNKQNFGPNDSMIASAVRHPLTGLLKAKEWLDAQMNTGMGMPYPQDEGSIYQYAPLDMARHEAALNIAGLAETGSIPFAPKSRGGILGTVARKADDLPETEFSKAHKIAQKNAALPIEQGGLGLPPDNTAMDRAKAMGFDINAYHGTTGDIEQFNPMFAGSSGVAKTGKDKIIWATSDADDAAFYAKQNIPRRLKELQQIKKHTPEQWDELTNLYNEMYQGIGLKREENILPLMISPGKTMEIDTKGIPSTFKNQGNIFSKSDANTMILKNANPGFADKKEFMSNFPYSEYYAVKDPKNIRSRFAAFDPMKRNSSNLLASGLLGSLVLNDYARDK